VAFPALFVLVFVFAPEAVFAPAVGPEPEDEILENEPVLMEAWDVELFEFVLLFELIETVELIEAFEPDALDPLADPVIEVTLVPLAPVPAKPTATATSRGSRTLTALFSLPTKMALKITFPVVELESVNFILYGVCLSLALPCVSWPFGVGHGRGGLIGELVVMDEPVDSGCQLPILCPLESSA